MTFTVQGYFRQILGTHKCLGTHDWKKVANMLKSPLHANCHSSTSIKATKLPRVPFKANGQSCFLLPGAFSDIISCCSAK